MIPPGSLPPTDPHGTPRQCRLCNRLLPPRSHSDVCDAPLCQTRVQVETDQRMSAALRARREAERQLRIARAGTLLDQLAQKLGATDRDEVPSTITPMIDLPLEPQEQDQIDRFAAHLDTLLGEIFADPDLPPEPPADLDERAAGMRDAPLALNAACIACQGDCCTLGRYRLAYLTTDDMAAFRYANPAMTAEEIRAAYLAQIPSQSVKNSCLFHGDKGCAMPRDMRSKLCNGWQCRARGDLGRQIERLGETRSVVLALAEDHDAHPGRGAPVIRAVSVTDGAEVRFHDDLELPPLPDPAAR